MQDYEEAVKWFRLAAQQGHPEAQFNLGLIYDQGIGVDQNNQEALKWYRLAAAQGRPSWHYNLGLMYAKGQGVLQDYVCAHMWFNISASLGFEFAALARDKAASQKTHEDISKAQQLARECVARDYRGC